MAITENERKDFRYEAKSQRQSGEKSFDVHSQVNAPHLPAEASARALYGAVSSALGEESAVGFKMAAQEIYEMLPE
eukprot:11726482-Prorocentrum_lima.AAC.1